MLCTFVAVSLLLMPFYKGVGAIEVPSEMRPAKAVEAPQPDSGSVPPSSMPKEITQQKQQGPPIPPSNARVPPNLSLRSRLIASLNSQLGRRSSSPRRFYQFDAPIVFEKKGKGWRDGKRKSKLWTSSKNLTYDSTSMAGQSRNAAPAMALPPGKNYRLNTVLHTNLIDAQGNNRLAGAGAISIRVSEHASRNKPEHTSTREVDAINGAENGQVIKVGSSKGSSDPQPNVHDA